MVNRGSLIRLLLLRQALQDETGLLLNRGLLLQFTKYGFGAIDFLETPSPNVRLSSKNT
jgi:hypothetical protein